MDIFVWWLAGSFVLSVVVWLLNDADGGQGDEVEKCGHCGEEVGGGEVGQRTSEGVVCLKCLNR